METWFLFVSATQGHCLQPCCLEKSTTHGGLSGGAGTPHFERGSDLLTANTNLTIAL